jgi:hypothetical protein
VSTPEHATTPSSGKRGVWIAIVSLLVAAVLVVAGVWAAGNDDEPTVDPSVVPTDGSSAPSSAPSDDVTPSAEPTPTPVAGCTPGGDPAPADADVAAVVDVDDDGEPDEAWISPGADRRFGITTASGATFSAPIGSASPQPAAAVVNVIQSEELPIALVDTGREALLFSLSDCAVTPVQNEQGDPYTFDRGFAGEGTGVACLEDGGYLRLAGLNAEPDSAGTQFDVVRTWVDLDATGRTATNGDVETVAEGVTADDDQLHAAQRVGCGELVAGDGNDGPIEPQS